MRRRAKQIVILGSMVMLMVALVAILAGPATATAATKVYFTETSNMWPVTEANTPWDPYTWIASKAWMTGPDDALHFRSLLLEGTTEFVAADGYELGFPAQAYTFDRISINGTQTTEKMISYVGATSADDVLNGELGENYVGIWEITAVSRPAADGITSLYTCEARGVAGVVDGWVMHFTCQTYPASELEWWRTVGEGSGFYIAN